jgi:hypothetical protein
MNKKQIFYAVTLLAIFAVVGNIWLKHSPTANTERLKLALNLKTLPPTLERLNCPPHDNVSEVVIQCTFTVEQTEFASLLSGYEFKEMSEHFFVVTHPPFLRGGDISLKRTVLESSTRYYVELNYFQK